MSEVRFGRIINLYEKHLAAFCIISLVWFWCTFFKLYKTAGVKSVLSYTDNAPLLASLTDTDQMNPSASDKYLVWQDNRNGNWDIYAIDTSTKTELQVTKNLTDQVSPSVSGELVVWIDYRINPLGDIYSYNFTTKQEKQITQDLVKQETLAVNGGLHFLSVCCLGRLQNSRAR